MPANAHTHETGCGAAIYLMQPGANTRVRTWCPTRGAQYGFLVTHNESISIADYFTARDASGAVIYRPTCHYAYHPADDAVLSLHELFGSGKMQEKHHILDENEIVDGIDELGVLLYGHGKNAYWFGSQLSIEETRELAPYQNATGLQVTSAVLGGMVWALEHPERRHRRGRRDGLPSPAGNPAALSRSGEGLLHRLDAAGRPAGLLPGGSRHERPLAIQERARAHLKHG